MFKSKKIYFWEWCLLGVIFFFLFVNFFYPDLVLTTHHSISFYDLLFKNDLYHLYEANYVFNGIFGNSCITYDFPIFVVIGLWNLPLLVLKNIFSFEWYHSFLGLLYSKSILIFFTFAALWAMNRILKLLQVEKNDRIWYHFLFLSSPIFLMVIGMFGGYDIISVFFTLLGIYYYLKNEPVKFLTFFALAISLKIFAIFLFIPLVLLKEKKLWKIFLLILAGVSVLLFAKIVYFHAPMYQESMNSFNDGMFQYLITNHFSGSFDVTSLFALFYGFVCIWCYCLKIKENKRFSKYVMYICLLVMSLFCTFVTIHPQWFILVLPYLCFYLIENKEERYTLFLLEIGYSVCMILVLICHYDWVFVPTLMDNMFIARLFPLQNIPSTVALIPRLNQFLPLLQGFAIACIVVYLYFNFPERKKDKKETESIPRDLVYVRLFFLLIPVSLILVSYFMK